MSLLCSSTASSVNVVFLDTFLDRYHDASWHLYLSRITENIYKGQAWSELHFLSISLSQYLYLLTSQTSLSHSKSSSQVIFELFQVSSSLCKFLISHFTCIFMFWNLGFGVFENFWGFSKLMSFCWNLGWVFPYVSLKSHTLHSMCIITVFSCI